ncbi:sterol transporter cytoplasmic membrane protein BstA [Methylotetracoccus oryzae]|uniref:sterol transporter cytoplasmic membrane protein BstA n=1 Tax=Methylotetracoccus oryzae TaxID=1919059 RepID=UPI0011185C38|nr:sterol transporter cytoplasmic membrane protein BstA [Methylotetracoccus oryzae]
MSQRVAKIAVASAKHPRWVLALALAISVLAAWATVQLPVYTSRQALLPQDNEVARRLDNFLVKFGAASDLIVVLDNAPREELESFANELAAKLRQEPEIRQVTERLDIRFFMERAYLLAPVETFDQVDTYLRTGAPVTLPGLPVALKRALDWIEAHPPVSGIDLATAEQSVAGFGLFLNEWQRWLEADTAPAGLDWKQLLATQGARGMGDGYFASRDGRMLFLFVHPENPSGAFEARRPFIEKVRAVAGELSGQAKAAGRTAPTVGLTGLPAVEYEEYLDIEHDIALVIWTAAGLIGALIVLVLRSFRWALAIFVPMGLGALWSLGLAFLTVGHLTIITSSFLAILFGLGADYGIFTSSRIAEERRAGRPLTEAIGLGIGSSFTTVLTAGGASLLIFSVLATLDFPGFSELGLIAAGGVLLILISTWMIQPALYALLPPRLTELSWRAAGPTQRRGSFPLPVAAILVLLALGSALAGAAKGFSIPFDYDVLALLPKDSEAAQYQRRMLAESDYQAEVVIFTAKDLTEAQRITDQARRLESIATVQSLANLFPPDGDERLRKARRLGEETVRRDYAGQLAKLDHAGLNSANFDLLRTLLARLPHFIDDAEEQAFSAGHSELVKGLEKVRGQIGDLRERIDRDPGHARERTQGFYRALLQAGLTGTELVKQWRTAEPLTPDLLPPALRDRFFAADGTVAVYAFPKETVYDPAKLDRLITDVYGVSPDATGFPTTHQVFSRSVVESFARGTVLAVAVCLIWLILILRDVRGVVLAALPLVIGGGWMLGLMWLGGLRYNYANIIALPLVIALAVDYGVWFSHRWRDLKGHTPLQVTLIAGKVIALAAGTELAGLGAISLARYRGISTLGIAITIGLVCCLAATLLVAPAIGQLIDRKRNS